jgi:hypothetical protein
MRTEFLTESHATELQLSELEARALEQAGKRLAATKTWWGADEASEQVDRTVIRCRPNASGRYAVSISDAVGVVAVGDLQIIVQPKIASKHFFYLLAASKAIPRLDTEAAELASSANLWDLVALWFIDALEGVISRDLIRDYREETAQLSAVRGRVVPLATARTFYGGSLKPTCVYEEFDNDNSLNRVLKAAAASVARSRLLESGLRRRAVGALAQMADVSELRVGDLKVSPDLRTAYYRDAWKLACQVLAGQGIEMLSGEMLAWTFLIRTPDLVEEGIRNLLQEALHPTWHLEKKGRQLIGAPITLNPDLVFEHGRLVGDVKYKLLSAWHQSDLYQAIAFATGYRASGALVISFLTDSQQTAPPDLIVGNLPVTPLTWMASSDVTPQQACSTLIQQVERWLGTRLGTESALRLVTA